MPRASGDIDPRRVHADPPKKRRRKRRGKPNPARNIKAAEPETVSRLEDMPLPPSAMLEPDGEGWRVEATHNDHELWVAHLAAAFGTRSISLLHTFLDQLKELCPQDYDHDLGRWKTNEKEWNALIALVADHQPENASQAALAAQMGSVHLMQIRLSKDALNNGGMVIEKSAALASKLARTYATQCETMMLLKGKKLPSRQTIRVEKTLRQEVHYHDHRVGGAEETDGQCDAKPIDGGELENETAGRIADLREVPGDNKGGEVVPLSRRAG